MRAFESLTGVVDGRRVILDDPPVISHFEIAGGPKSLEKVFLDYRATIAENRRELVERYRFVDFALKVVGVGSVGTRCFVRPARGPRRGRPALPPGEGGDRVRHGPVPDVEQPPNHGERVVVGQR